MLTAIVILAVFALIIGGILSFISAEDRYSRMTEKEFQEEAERASLAGAAMMGLEKVLQPKRVEYIMQRDKRVEGEQSEAGDLPPGPDPKPPAAPDAK